MANGKIRDSPIRRDPCLKIRDRDLKVLTKSEPETLYEENRARDFILQKYSRFRKLFAARHELNDILRQINIRSISQKKKKNYVTP